MARVLFALLFTLFAPGAAAQSFNAQEQAEIRAIVREYLIRNPDVLQDALEALQERTAAERWRRTISDPRDFSIGPADAPIVIVEFYDYRCGFCHAALQWVTDIARTRRDVRVVLKELPILSPESMEAARAVLAAAPQGRTWQFHRALMSFPLDQQLSSAQIDRLARSVGIDVARMRRAMESPEIIALLEDNRGLALDVTASPATPLFMINGEVISGFDQPRLEERLREATREARDRRSAQR
ncbi:MAG TPA: DsbA family protein [Vitreimonas sp.]|uniref:DsbA family protein n=1 Tax=Vitreimonas sp. TaxID=3069702 RepID=UPI002D4E690E|nr:DsbA family protein [Vitreimonas sp.]HYD88395.1 DsbA family protein [Vitreimonas sp.]